MNYCTECGSNLNIDENKKRQAVREKVLATYNVLEPGVSMHPDAINLFTDLVLEYGRECVELGIRTSEECEQIFHRSMNATHRRLRHIYLGDRHSELRKVLKRPIENRYTLSCNIIDDNVRARSLENFEEQIRDAIKDMTNATGNLNPVVNEIMGMVEQSYRLGFSNSRS